jgi:hypothetical protein
MGFAVSFCVRNDRAIVEPCRTMDVIIKIEDILYREARHRAVDRGLSLSGWIAGVVRKELAGGKSADGGGLMEALAMEDGEERGFEIPRDSSLVRDLEFS